MKKIALVALMASCMAVGGLGAELKNVNKKVEAQDARIIVQIKGGTNGAEEDILAVQNQALSQIRNYVTGNFTVRDRYSHVINGFALDVPSGYVSQIRNLDFVKNVEYRKSIPGHVTNNDEAVTLNIKKKAVTEPTKNVSAETMNVPANTKAGEGTVIAILDNSFLIDATVTSKNEDGESVTREHVTHNAFTALDSGVQVKETQQSIKDKIDGAQTFHGKYDATHSTYFNNKVVFYYDYGGDSDNNYEEDYDVYGVNQDHGNHVATIAAGNDPLYKGIAYNAQLCCMKVFTTEADGTDGAYNDVVLKALEDCYVLDVDVINMSFGSNLTEAFGSLYDEIVTNLVEHEIFCGISAGNNGKRNFVGSPYENFTTSNVEPGTFGHDPLDGLSVAAGQANEEFYETAFIIDGKSTVSFQDQIENYNSTDGEVVYTPERHITDLLEVVPDGNFEYVKVPGFGQDTTENPDYKNIDVEGKIAIVDRGESTFVDKITNATNHGAIAVGIIDNDPTNTDFSFRMDLSGWTPAIPVISILFRDRDIFGEAEHTGTCQLLKDVVAINPTAKQITAFTSQGALYDLTLKPEITAPGQNILGGVLPSEDSYDYYDGTSMASPNMVGAIALALGENLQDPTYRKTLISRLMSTADPSTDGLNKGAGEEQCFLSPKSQGAGYVNVEKALNANVILDSTTTEETVGKAKIELKNNADIAKGDVKLSFSALSELDTDKEFTATTYVYRPDLVELDPENENFVGLTGVKYQSMNNHLIGKVSQKVTVKANGLTNINLATYTIPNEEQKLINDNFENGTYIEGFVFLEAEGEVKISIPFMGFYGNYLSGSPVEPFKFERDNSKIYESDLLNYVTQKWGGSTEADFSSDWVMGNFNSFEDVAMEDLIYNNKNLRSMVDSNAKKLVSVGTNPYTGEVDSTDIYMGNNGYRNTMIIQQFVTRTVTSNTITITSKASEEVVLEDHMFDSLFGATVDEDGNDVAWPLLKTVVDTNYYAAKVYASRAYTIIPLYSMDDNQKKIADFPDGEYEVKFSYEVAAGYTYEKSYTLHIDSKAPVVESIESFEDAGEEYYRVRFDELKFSYTALNGSKKVVKQDEKGYYYDVKVSDYVEKGFLFFKSYDYAYGVSCSLTAVNDPNHIVIQNDNISLQNTFTSTITQPNDTTKEVELKIFKGADEVSVKGDLVITIKVFDGMSLDDSLTVYEVDANGNYKRVEFQEKDGFVTFAISGTKFALSSDATLAKDEPKGGCGGTIVASSTVLALSSAICLFFLIKAKRKEEDYAK